MLTIKYQPNFVQNSENLYKAYQFAKQNALTPIPCLQAHQIITAHLPPKSDERVLRIGNMVILEHNTGRLQHEAAPASQVKNLFKVLWSDIK